MLRYILTRGVLLWGVCTTLPYLGIQRYYFHSLPSTGGVIRTLVTFMIGGIVWGALMWPLHARRRE